MNAPRRAPRKPTQWDKVAARQVDRPEPGVWLVRLVKDGPIVPAVIYYPCPWIEPDYGSDAHPDDWCRPADRSRRMRAHANGLPANPYQIWTTRSEVTDADEYAYRVAVADWARKWKPDAPEADAYKPIPKPAAEPSPKAAPRPNLATHATLF